MDLLSIVILNYNGRHLLEKFLPSVVRYCEGFRIYVIDNGSVDNSYDLLCKNFPTVNILSFARNEGFAGGYNTALRQIESKYYILLNTDVEVTRGWLAPLLAFMESNRECAACQPKILSYLKRESFEYAGAAGGFIDLLGYPFCRGRIFNTLEDDLGQYDDVREIFWTSGACMIIRSESFHSAGGFDASFFAHMEEIDLCWRLKRRGWKVYFIFESKVYHLGGGTLMRSNPRKTYLNFRNNLAMLMKNLSWKTMLWVLPVRLLFDAAAALKFLLSGSPADATAVWKAWLFLPFRSGKYLRIAKTMKTDIEFRCMKGFYPKSIILEYFLKGKKQFHRLGA
ncbi:MAG TPA: glycosyltransferase family 2 protein [Cyclobacteriaceae bacterium]|nr:glycosyltransferase family 2 protein [Cyclobacteriaceae bacterium]